MPKYPEIQFKHILEANALFRLCLYDAKWKAAVTKNQSIWSAAGWTKEHIMLSLTPVDAYMKPVRWIRINFSSVEINRHPSRRTFLLDQQPGCRTVLTGLVLTYGLCLSQDRKPTAVILSNVGKSQAPSLILQKAYQRHLVGRDILMLHLHQHPDSERSSAFPDWESPIQSWL